MKTDTAPRPLTAAMHAMWLAEELLPGTNVNNLGFAATIDGPLDVPMLRGALADLVGALVAMAAVPRDHAGPPPLAAGRG